MSRNAGAVALVISLLVAGCSSSSLEPDLPRVTREWKERDPSQIPKSSAPESRSSINLSDGVDLTEAEEICLYFNPGLRLARARGQVPQAGLAGGSRWDDPQLELEVERIFEDVEDEWVLAAGIEFSIPVTGRTQARQAQRLARFRATMWEASLAEWETLGQLRRAWIDYSTTIERQKLVQALLDDLTQVRQTVDLLQSAGALRTIEARVFTIEAVRQTGELARLESLAEQQTGQILRLLGLSSSARLTWIPSLDVPAAPVPLAEGPEFLARHHPQIQLLQAQSKLSDRDWDWARRSIIDDPTLTPGFAYEDGESRGTLGLRLGLPIWNRNQSAIGEAQAAQDVSRLAIETTYEALLGQLQLAASVLQAAEQRRQFLDNEVIPLVERQLTETKLEAERGDLDVVLLQQSILAAHEAKVERLEALREEALAATEIRILFSPAPDQAEGH